MASNNSKIVVNIAIMLVLFVSLLVVYSGEIYVGLLGMNVSSSELFIIIQKIVWTSLGAGVACIIIKTVDYIYRYSNKKGDILLLILFLLIAFWVVVLYIGAVNIDNFISVVVVATVYLVTEGCSYVPTEKEKILKRKVKVKISFSSNKNIVLKRVISIQGWTKNQEQYFQVSLNTARFRERVGDTVMEKFQQQRGQEIDEIKLRLYSTRVPMCKEFKKCYFSKEIISTNEFSHLIFTDNKN